jgi:hypothetical protein
MRPAKRPEKKRRAWRRRDAVELAARTRHEQGLPATVEDPEILDRIVRLMGYVPERERP